jgi:ABC-type branched-subunit amino acid transport system substrate-binding protein
MAAQAADSVPQAAGAGTFFSAANAKEFVANQKKISAALNPGVNAKSITVGSMIPSAGANVETGNAVRSVLIAYFDELNQRGGIYGRRILLRFADAGTDRGTALKNAQRLAAEPVFAMVAPFVPGAEKNLAALARAKKTPLVGLLALSVPDEPANRDVFYLLPGFQQLEQELIRFSAVQDKGKPQKTAIVVADRELQADVAPAMQATWKELSMATPPEFELSEANGTTLVHEMQSQEINTVFFIGEGEQVSPWLKAADSAGWAPRTFVLGSLLDENIFDLSARFQNKIFAAYPQLLPDPGAVDEFDDFLQRNQLAGDHRLVQISAYTAAEILETAMVRAGRNITREKLILSLEQMRDFKTGLLPGITFGPNRRIGSTRAEIVCVDLKSHSFQLECGKEQPPQ